MEHPTIDNVPILFIYIDLHSKWKCKISGRIIFHRKLFIKVTNQTLTKLLFHEFLCYLSDSNLIKSLVYNLLYYSQPKDVGFI